LLRFCALYFVSERKVFCGLLHRAVAAEPKMETDFFLQNCVDVGTQASDDMSSAIERLAVYIANLFFLTSDTSAPILRDRDLTEEVAGSLSYV